MAKQPNQKVISKKHLARLEREQIQQRYLIIGTIVVIILVIGFILYGVLDQTVFTRLRPVARVGNETITSGEFSDEVRFDRLRSIQQLESLTSDEIMVQYFSSYIQEIGSRLISPTTLGQNILDSMIEDILVAQEAKKRQITLTDKEIDEEMASQFGYFENGTPTPTITATPYVYSTATLSPTQLALMPPAPTAAPTEAVTEAVTETTTPEPSETPEASLTPTPEASPTITPTATITPTPTPYTKELYEQNVDDYIKNAAEINLSQNQLREFIRKQLLKRKVQEAITADVKAVDEQVWARHILVATEDEAKAVLSRLQAGETFAALAAELSLDESSKVLGGDLSWFTRSQMVKPFADAAFALGIGEISQPVQSEFGYHIIQVLGKEIRPLSDQQLENAKQAAYQTWLEEAKKAANVVTYERWMEIVPTDPEIPANVLQVLQTLTQQ